MTLIQKQIYVSGFLDGNNSGSAGLCFDLEQQTNIVELKPPRDLDPSDHPCMRIRRSYSHGNSFQIGTFGYVEPYITVIDDFYKHAECRAMPYPFLMEHLDDAEYRSGEDLYKFVRSGDAAWGSFSGFDGIENCYGVDQKH